MTLSLPHPSLATPLPLSAVPAEGTILASYLDGRGRPREVLAHTAVAGSRLVVDRDRATRGDCRLLAHLPADEPAANAALVCRQYLQDPPRRRCRALTAEDRVIVPFADEAQELCAAASSGAPELRDRWGWSYRLEAVGDDSSTPQLRWCRRLPGQPACQSRTVSVREVIGALERYRPVRALTVAALLRERGRARVSVSRLSAELERANTSRIVLNRALRGAVLAVVRDQGLSLSEIALRCGRVKYDARGNASGETTWLSRRVGLAPEGGRRVSTPWVHTDVLALIARRGLGLSPHEVEVE